MKKTYTHLGLYSDLVAATARCHPIFPHAKPGKRTQKLVLDTLAFSHKKEVPQNVRVDRRWKKDGVIGEEISWWVGYGPRTKAWLLRPEGAKGKLPGVLALHDHGGYKHSGKEKIADGPAKAPRVLQDFRDLCYGGRAFANELAKQGFAVLVHDTFLWGSRNFPLKTVPEFDRATGGRMRTYWFPKGTPRHIGEFNSTAVYHETTVSKYCSLLGTTLAGVIAYEDRIAANYLFGRKDICNGRLGCVGLSGGGLRAGLLQGTCNRINAAVAVGMMSTSEGLLDKHVVCHTWMLFPAQGWGRYGDWADLVACRAPSPLLVQYDTEDSLFSIEGMRAADQRLKKHYRSVGAAKNYRGEFYPGPHKFDIRMQKAAFSWLGRQLRPK